MDALRLDAGAWLPGMSYVAEAPDGTVAAYALLTRCHVDDAPALALAPVAGRRSTSAAERVRPSYGRYSMWPGCRGNRWCWSSAIRTTIRGSVSNLLRGTESGHLSRYRMRP